MLSLSQPCFREHLRIHENGYIMNTGMTLIVIVFSDSLPPRSDGKKIWRVVKPTTPQCNKPSSIRLAPDEELAVESCFVYMNDLERVACHLADCQEQIYCDQNWPCGLPRPLFVSRQEIYVAVLIDVIVKLYFQVKCQGARYVGCQDYEVDVHRIDDQDVCRILIRCIAEVQILMEDSGITQNVFYLCLIETHWNVFSGWISERTCQTIHKLPHKVAFSRTLYYPYLMFSCEEDDDPQIIGCHRLCNAFGNAARSPSGSIDLIVDK